jgi:hypothetical protein
MDERRKITDFFFPHRPETLIVLTPTVFNRWMRRDEGSDHVPEWIGNERHKCLKRSGRTGRLFTHD